MSSKNVRQSDADVVVEGLMGLYFTHVLVLWEG